MKTNGISLVMIIFFNREIYGLTKDLNLSAEVALRLSTMNIIFASAVKSFEIYEMYKCKFVELSCESCQPNFRT
jgi:hypothetical protein